MVFDGRRQPSEGDTSRMNREVHVRFCEGLGVRFPGATRRVLQKHEEEEERLPNRAISCAEDDGGPIGTGFQEQASNQSKLLRLRGVVVSVGSKVRKETGQVCI